jgi:hypothetical protein
MKANEAIFEDNNNVHVHFIDGNYTVLEILDIEHFKNWLDSDKDFYHMDNTENKPCFVISKRNIIFINYKQENGALPTEKQE